MQSYLKLTFHLPTRISYLGGKRHEEKLSLVKFISVSLRIFISSGIRYLAAFTAACDMFTFFLNLNNFGNFLSHSLPLSDHLVVAHSLGVRRRKFPLGYYRALCHRMVRWLYGSIGKYTHASFNILTHTHAQVNGLKFIRFSSSTRACACHKRKFLKSLAKSNLIIPP